jgi:hypothetical protein
MLDRDPVPERSSRERRLVLSRIAAFGRRLLRE